MFLQFELPLTALRPCAHDLEELPPRWDCRTCLILDALHILYQKGSNRIILCSGAEAKTCLSFAALSKFIRGTASLGKHEMIRDLRLVVQLRGLREDVSSASLWYLLSLSCVNLHRGFRVSRTRLSYPQNFPLLEHWLQGSLAKGLGAMYSQLPYNDAFSAGEVVLPTRVLDIMPEGPLQACLDGPDQIKSIRLVIPAPNTKGRYATLSHRWGSDHTYSLTSDSLDSMQDKISCTTIPKTYRDAVVIARHLGYRYLWIDSLCIVQDDATDWLDQAANMASVYHNSSFTIAAHCSSNDNDGILSRPTTPSRLNLRKTPASSSSISQRGWVFQEMVLSRRILHFLDSKNVVFEDASGIFADSSKGIYHTQDTPPFVQALPSNAALLPDKPKFNLEDSYSNSVHWYQLVEEYTTRELSFQSDRLPAIAGLAEYYAQIHDDGTYMCGLWSKSLHQGLLWVNRSEEPTEVAESPPQRGLPSWSWARWAGRTNYPAHLSNCHPLCTFINDTKPSYDGPSITMSASVFALSQVNMYLNDRPPMYEDSWVPTHNTYAISHATTSSGQVMNHFRTLYITLDAHGSRRIKFDRLLLCQVARSDKKKHFYDDESESVKFVMQHLYYFLLLEEEERTDSIRKTYSRVGVGACPTNYLWKTARKDVLHLV